jgi:hypothetical protein
MGDPPLAHGKILALRHCSWQSLSKGPLEGPRSFISLKWGIPFGGFAFQSMKQGIHSGNKQRVGDVLLRIRDEFTGIHL